MNYQSLRLDGIALDEISSGGLRVRIRRLGAEMVSLVRDGTGYLVRDGEVGPPASGWGNHATVMGYFIHRLWDGQSSYRGSVIRGGTHGFLRHFAFEEPEQLADGLLYRVAADRIPQDAYPLKVSLALSYRLTESGLRVEFAFHNEEPALEAHVSFGLHPGFVVSTIAGARILLPAGRYVRHMAPGNFLDDAVVELDFPGGEFPYPREELEGSYLLGIDGVAERLFRLEDPVRRTSVLLDFSEAPYVTFWSNSDNFICIEPCWGLPDSNPPVAFEKKAGIQIIPPGATLRRGFTIQPGFLE